MNNTNNPASRLYNEYGASAGNPHADALDKIMDTSMEAVTAYIAENNVCPRDATGYCIASIEGLLATYTLRRAMKMKKERDAISSANTSVSYGLGAKPKDH